MLSVGREGDHVRVVSSEQDLHVEVVAESATTAGVIKNTTTDLRIYIVTGYNNEANERRERGATNASKTTRTEGGKGEVVG